MSFCIGANEGKTATKASSETIWDQGVSVQCSFVREDDVTGLWADSLGPLAEILLGDMANAGQIHAARFCQVTNA
jgi:hypothetical protein